jgi:hypothetical protein
MRALRTLAESALVRSVILFGRADDLVVLNIGCEHAGGGVRGHRFVCAIAASFAGGASDTR